MERALAQFIPTARPDLALRDDMRRRHNNMHDWFDLGDAETRRYDLVMLRVLLSQKPAAGQFVHKGVRVRTVFLALDGAAGTCAAHVSGSGVPDGDVSELHLHLNARVEPRHPADLVEEVMKCLAPHIDRRKRHPLARIRFDFPRQPGERVLALANLVAEALRGKLPDSTRIDAFWNWRGAGSPIVGVVGHRDLTAFGGIGPVTERLRQCFMDLIMQQGVEAMVTGYAPGADRAAVEAWASLGLPRPVLVFPFTGVDADGRRVWFTEDPVVATEETTVTDDAAKRIGLPVFPSGGEGHRAQADEVLGRTEILLVVLNEQTEVLDGGSRDTLSRAREANGPAIVIAPSSP